MPYFCCSGTKGRHHVKEGDTYLVKVPYQKGAAPLYVVKRNQTQRQHVNTRTPICCSGPAAYFVTFLLIFPVVPLMQSFPIPDCVKKIHSKTLCIEYNSVKRRKKKCWVIS